jgi:hypothetical protein
MRKRYLLVVGALAATVIAVGVAYAAIPGAGGVIQGCYDSGGNVKVVSALPCPKGYTSLVWNQQGPPGTPGAPGQPGTPGQNGQPGANGASVTNTVEPAGSNCPTGGSRFVVGTGSPTFACNGAKGDPGSGSLTSSTFTNSTSVGATNGSYSTTATCTSGTVIGGGYTLDPGGPGLSVTQNYPSSTTGWTATVLNTSGNTATLTAYAICAT